MSTPPQVYDEPSEVSTESDVVMVDGPGGIAVAFTPEAAAETSIRLADGAAEARGKKLMDDARKKPPD